MSALIRLREKRGSRPARKASSRIPASPLSTRNAAFSIASAMTSDDSDGPLDPAAERLRRKLARLLLVSGGIMMLGLIAVFGAIVYRLGMFGEEWAGSTGVGADGPVEAAIDVPANGRLIAAELDGGRALLTIQD